MSSNVIKNFLSKSSTRLYPFEVRDPFDACRYELYNDIEECIFCGNCQRTCPSQCITVDKTSGVWDCDPFACVYCSICVEACPVHCLHQKKTHREPATERQMIHMQGTPPQPKKKAKKTQKDDNHESNA
jgi:formate hydrogenlyase subunit 6/NADH:ubiquinone oxidoreductase subunit I